VRDANGSRGTATMKWRRRWASRRSDRSWPGRQSEERAALGFADVAASGFFEQGAQVLVHDNAIVSSVVEHEIAGPVAAVGIGVHELVLHGDLGLPAAGVIVQLSGEPVAQLASSSVHASESLAGRAIRGCEWARSIAQS
jgi:hypothetical protein